MAATSKPEQARMNDPTFASIHRVRTLGGSDAAPACGVEVYGRNRITLWREMTGRAERPNVTSRPIRRGVTLEDWIANEYALARGVRVRRRSKPIRNRAYPWAHATVDRRVAGTRIVLECKSVHPLALFRGEEWGEDGSDDVPAHYLLQCAHYNYVCDAERTDLAAMFGDELRIYHIGRSPELEARMMELERDLWERARADVEPDPLSAAEVRSLYPVDDGSAIVAPPPVVHTVERMARLKAQIKASETELDALRDAVQIVIAEGASLIDETGRELVTWKKAKDSIGTDWQKAFEESAAYLAPEVMRQILEAAKVTKPGNRRFLIKLKPE
jgi:putative phage-type endonuclease